MASEGFWFLVWFSICVIICAIGGFVYMEYFYVKGGYDNKTDAFDNPRAVSPSPRQPPPPAGTDT